MRCLQYADSAIFMFLHKLDPINMQTSLKSKLRTFTRKCVSGCKCHIEKTGVTMTVVFENLFVVLRMFNEQLKTKCALLSE